MTVDDPRFPTGKFEYNAPLTREQRDKAIERISLTPARLREAVSGLSQEQLDMPYRDGGWTVRQVVHHVPDSHMNALIRTKLALTENEPPIKPYDERAWANLADVRNTPIETSLVLLETLHERWIHLLRSLSETDFRRTLMHPEHGVRTLDWLVSLYAWHGAHHVAHVTSLRERMGWK